MQVIKDKEYLDKEVILGIRPEDIHDDPVVIEAYSNAVINVTVDVAELLGAETNVYATIGNDAIIASVPARADLEKGSAVKLAFDMNHCHVFDAETELALF